VFSLLNDKQRTAAINAMWRVSKTSIEQAFQAAGFDAKEVKELTDAAWARRKWMLEVVTNQTKPAQLAKVLTPKEAKDILESAGLYEIKGKGSVARMANRNNWTSDEAPFKAAIKAYSGADFSPINNGLRAGGSKTMEDVALVINQALAAMPRYTGQVKRGIRYTIDQAWIDKAIQASKDGSPVEFIGYSSAGKVNGWRKKVNAVIEATGLQGVDIDGAGLTKFGGEGGGEVLVPHKARFFLKHVVPEPDGTFTFYLVEDPKALLGTAVKLAID
jgi:hypothetical protein